MERNESPYMAGLMRHRVDPRASMLAAAILCGLAGMLCARAGIPPASSSAHRLPLLVSPAGDPGAADGAGVDLCAGIPPRCVAAAGAPAHSPAGNAAAARRGRFRSQLPRISLPPPRRDR